MSNRRAGAAKNRAPREKSGAPGFQGGHPVRRRGRRAALVLLVLLLGTATAGAAALAAIVHAVEAADA